ncbi:ABC transporter permease subunit [Halocatena pleomorpha]|uniref:ABC transporter permease n=1 Tax=Halocatena pleomorpha TaxID=1785090 RepID=A0A3P3RKG5_9EURY|nr:ABC transporter permease subunit [Halocatena pleomorpha]RRJ34001.1 ABC transporter permease [Halocatena pleomorpha]
MSILLVAKKDFQDAIRSLTLVAVVGIFTAFLAFYTYYEFTMTPLTTTTAFDLYQSTANAVVVIGTLLGYKSIAGERESGSLKFLLGAPHTRRDVVLGKFLGRVAVVVVTVVIGFVVVSPHYVMLAASPSVTAYVGLIGRLLVPGVVFVAVALALSAASRSTTVAMWGAIVLAIVFAFAWDMVRNVIESFMLPPDAGIPNWFRLITRFNPKYFYLDAQTLELGNAAPFYLEPWFGGVIVAGWLLIPLGLAYLLFERSDLA